MAKKTAIAARSAQHGLFEPAPQPLHAAPKAKPAKKPGKRAAKRPAAAVPAEPAPPPTAPVRTPKGGKPAREDAHTMAARQREISISEFFTKNRHLLGFDNPQKALLTAI